jgi:hypothetical protein
MTFLGLPIRVARAVVIALVALDVLALVAFSVHRTTTTAVTTRPAAVPEPVAPVTSAPAWSTPVAAPAPAVPVSVPLGATPPVVTSVPLPTTSTTPPPRTATPPPATTPPTTPPPTASPAATCPVKLTDKPVPKGGLQSLIDFAPAFGDFSAEAFAMAAAYQPALQLLGPVLAKYPSLAPKFAPYVTPFVSTFAKILNTGFVLLGPLYSPYRTQFLQAETKFAAALAPYAEKLAGSPLGDCVVQLETALVTR